MIAVGLTGARIAGDVVIDSITFDDAYTMVIWMASTAYTLSIVNCVFIGSPHTAILFPNAPCRLNVHETTFRDESGARVLYAPNQIFFTMTNSHVRNYNFGSQAVAIFSNGGGGSTFTILNCTFTDNIASSTGGLFAITNAGLFTLTNSTFDNNQCGGNGGVIFLSSTTAVLKGNTFTQNQGGQGSVLYHIISNVQASNNYYANNHASSMAALFKATGGSLTIADETFCLNTALVNPHTNDVGVINACVASGGCTVDEPDCCPAGELPSRTDDENVACMQANVYASESGVGDCLTVGTPCNLATAYSTVATDGTIHLAVDTYSSGLIVVKPLTIMGTDGVNFLSANIQIGVTGSRLSGTVIIDSVRFMSSAQTMSVWMDTGSDILILRNCLFDGATADSIITFETAATMIVDSCTFKNANARAIGANVGVLQLTMTGSILQDLAPTAGWGGGIYVTESGSALVITNSSFIGLKSSSQGGALALELTTLHLNDSYFEGCSTGKLQRGGAWYLHTTGTVVAYRNVYKSCVAKYGSAVALGAGSQYDSTGETFAENHASSQAAIFSLGTVAIKEATFCLNYANLFPDFNNPGLLGTCVSNDGCLVDEDDCCPMNRTVVRHSSTQVSCVCVTGLVDADDNCVTACPPSQFAVSGTCVRNDTLFVSDSGVGDCLTDGTPCLLASAYSILPRTGTIEMAAGTYNADQTVTQPLTIRGATGSANDVVFEAIKLTIGTDVAPLSGTVNLYSLKFDTCDALDLKTDSIQDVLNLVGVVFVGSNIIDVLTPATLFIDRCEFSSSARAIEITEDFSAVILTMRNSIVSDLSATLYGGAISCYQPGSIFTIVNCTFTNIQTTHDGGALYLYDAGLLYLNESIFTSCHAGSNSAGGALYFSGEEAVLHNNVFTSNTAKIGSAITISSGADLSSSGDVFSLNHASQGTTMVQSGTMVFADAVFCLNTASESDPNTSPSILADSGCAVDPPSCCPAGESVSRTNASLLACMPTHVYASESGGGDCLTVGTPCNLATAYSAVATDGTIHLAGDIFTTGLTLLRPVNIQGTDGTIFDAVMIQVGQSGTTLSSLSIEAVHFRDAVVDMEVWLASETDSLTLKNVIFEKCSGSDGAVVLKSAGTLIAHECLWDDLPKHCIYFQNDAQNRHLRISNSTMQIVTLAGQGAGVFSQGAGVNSIKIYNTTFDVLNGTHGGAIFQENGSLEIIDCVFNDCTATDQGGAVYYDGALSLLIVSSAFIGSQAAFGSALFIDQLSNAQVQSCTFASNHATNSGAIYQSGNNITLTSSDFCLNAADSSDPDAVPASLTTECATCTFEAHSCCPVGQLVSRASINSVTCINPPHAFATPSGTGDCFTLDTPCSLTSAHVAVASGGTLHMGNGTYTAGLTTLKPLSFVGSDTVIDGVTIGIGLTGSRISGNVIFDTITFVNAPDMIVWLDSASDTLSLRNVVFENCGVTGGAISVKTDCTLIVDASLWINATVRAIEFPATAPNQILIMTNSTMQNISLGGGLGGGIFSWGGFSTITVQNSTFIGLSALRGGAIWTRDGSVNILDSVFYECSVTELGSAIYVFSGASTLIRNSVFIENHSDQYGGAIGYWIATNVQIDLCTFTLNNAGISGGAIYLSGGSIALNATDFCLNSAGTSDPTTNPTALASSCLDCAVDSVDCCEPNFHVARTSSNEVGCHISNAYVSPSGSGDCLTIGTPCSLATAYSYVKPSGTIHLASGIYTTGLTLLKPVNINGTSGTILNTQPIQVGESGTELTSVTIENVHFKNIPVDMEVWLATVTDSLTLKNVVFENCGFMDGVVILQTDGILNVEGCTWKDGSVRGIFFPVALSSQYLVMSNTIMSNINIGGGDWGAGMACSGSNSNYTIRSSNFIDLSSDAGSALYLFGGYAEIDSCLFSGCNALSGPAGALLRTTSISTFIINSTFVSNEASDVGGALKFDGANDVKIDLSVFTSNHASNMGGAIYQNNGDVTVSNSEFCLNTAVISDSDTVPLGLASGIGCTTDAADCCPEHTTLVRANSNDVSCPCVKTSTAGPCVSECPSDEYEITSTVCGSCDGDFGSGNANVTGALCTLCNKTAGCLPDGCAMPGYLSSDSIALCLAGCNIGNRTCCSEHGNFSVGGVCECDVGYEGGECETACPKGSFTPGGTVACDLCDAGSYTDLVGQSICISCGGVDEWTNASGANDSSLCQVMGCSGWDGLVYSRCGTCGGDDDDCPCETTAHCNNVTLWCNASNTDPFLAGCQPRLELAQECIQNDACLSGRCEYDYCCASGGPCDANVVVTVVGSGHSNENGSEAHFTLHLNLKPADVVTITFSSNEPLEGTLSTSSLKFFPENATVPQLVDVIGVDDLVQDGDQTFHIVFDPPTSTDTRFDGLTPPSPLPIINDDDDVAGIDIDVSLDPAVTSEQGQACNISVKLRSKPAPSETVMVTATSKDNSEGTITGSPIEISESDWTEWHVFTVTGADDGLIDGAQTYEVWIESSGEGGYDDLSTPVHAVLMTNLDDDSTEMLQVSSVDTATDESGTSFIAAVAIGAAPIADIVVNVSTTDTTEATVSPSQLTFTVAQWMIPKFVTVTGVDDDVADGDQSYNLELVAAIPGGGVANASLSLTNTDDDVVGVVTTFATGGATKLIVSEIGTTDMFHVHLTSEPVDDVFVAMTCSDVEASIAPSTLAFTAFDWETDQTVAVTGKLDGLADTDKDIDVTLAITSNDAGYNALTNVDVPLEVLHVWESEVTSVSPKLLAVAGGESVTIKGAMFADTMRVFFNDVEADNDTIVVELSGASARGSMTVVTPEFAEEGVYVTLKLLAPRGYVYIWPETATLFVTDKCPRKGMYGAGKDCIDCPEGAVCPGGFRMWPKPGYWTPNEEAGFVISCEPNPERCAGGMDSGCADGYEGDFCASCSPGYHPVGEKCQKCPTTEEMSISFMTNVVFFGLLIASIFILDDQALMKAVSLLLIIQKTRTVGVTGGGGAEQPAIIKQFYAGLSVATLDFEIIPAGCSILSGLPPTFAVTFFGNLLLVVVVIVFTLGAMSLAAKKSKVHTIFFKNRRVRASTIMWSVVYVIVTQRSLQALLCVDGGDIGWRLAASPSTVCGSPEHIGMAVVAALLLLVVSLGIPVILLVMLLKKRSKLDESVFAAQWGDLYQAYKPAMFWWGVVVETLFAFGLTASKALLVLAPEAQSSVTFGVIGMYAVALAMIRPFKTVLKNVILIVAALSIAMAVALNLGGIVELGPVIPFVLTYSILVMCIVGIASTVIAIVRGYTQRRAAVGPVQVKKIEEIRESPLLQGGQDEVGEMEEVAKAWDGETTILTETAGD